MVNDFDISQYLDSKEIKKEYLVQVLKDGDMEEFENMLEDFEDLTTVVERKDEKSTLHEEVLKELKQDDII